MRKLALWLIAVVIVLVISRQLIVRTLSQTCLRRLTGVSAEIHSASLGWRHGKFEVRNLACTNLNAGGTLITAHAPLLVIDYEPLSLFRRELHVYDLACEIQTLAMVHQRSEPGRLHAAPRGDAARPAVRVDALHLKLDGTFSYDNQKVTGKMQATLHDVQDVESFRALLKSP